MTTYPLPTLAPTIGPAGISIPALEDILLSLQAEYRALYGLDVDLASDTQDGQWIAIQAQAIYDTNDRIATVFNGFSPTYAQGAALSSLVKINGLRREAPSFSTTALALVGQAGTMIPSGIVVDTFGNQWTLPPNVTIPTGGAITVTGTCSVPGAILPAPGTITQIVTIIPGWQSVNNPSSAAPGAPVEDDAQLRQRQSISTSLPAQTPLQSILANVANLPGVERYAIYSNDGFAPDSNGVPAHSIALVVQGGNIAQTALAIEEKKAPGTGTFGTTSVIVLDPSGVPDTINFFVLTTVSVYFSISIRALANYVNSTGQLILAAVAAAINALNIGVNVYVNRLWAPANLSGDAALSVAGGLTQAQLDALSATYTVTALSIGLSSNPSGPGDIILDFHSAAVSATANGTLTTL